MIPGRLTYTLLGLSLGIAAAGCSHGKDDLPREPVAGTVTMDGQSLPEARIQFSPLGNAAKGETVGANAEVKDGQFSIPREDGLVPGNYAVRVSHAEMQDAKNKKGVATGRKKLGPEMIPSRYNTKSELKAEIKQGGASDLKFELKSK